MKTKLATLALIAVTIMSCNSGKNTSSDSNSDANSTTNNSDIQSIENTKWVIAALESKDMADVTNNGQSIFFTLNPKDNRVNGYSGCNTFMGTYKLEGGNRISFSQMGSTRMACPDVNINEQDVLKVFEMADNYTITNGKLALNKAKRAPLAEFSNADMHDNSITEKYWKLKTLEGKDVKMAKNQEKEIYFILKTDGNRVTGFTGCNTLGGVYTLEKGNRIRFSNMLGTLKACPDVDVNESEFLKVFELADNYTIVNDVLSLNVGRRAPLAVFEAIYFD